MSPYTYRLKGKIQKNVLKRVLTHNRTKYMGYTVNIPVILVTPPRAAHAPTIAYKPGVTHVCPLLHISLNM